VRLFENILQSTPDELDDVLIEADGEWHSSDSKYASAMWRARHPMTSSSRNAQRTPSLGEHVGRQAQISNIVSLCDTDEEDESTVRHELSRSNAAGPTGPTTVIDLTLDSDSDSDDEGLVAGGSNSARIPSTASSTSSSLKRKAEEAGAYTDAHEVHQTQRPRLGEGLENGHVTGYAVPYYGPHSGTYSAGVGSRAYTDSNSMSRSPVRFAFRPPSSGGDW
jgi:hypothetical protein